MQEREKTEEFVTKHGLRQGGKLTPLLFIAFLDRIAKKVEKR